MSGPPRGKARNRVNISSGGPRWNGGREAELAVLHRAQGMQLREASRSEAESEGLQPGPAKQDAPDD